MSAAEAFFAEQDRRMRIPDEDVDEYIKTRRILSEERVCDAASHTPINPRRHIAGDINSAEPEPMSLHTTLDTDRCAKRRKIMRKHPDIPDGLSMGPSSSRTTAGRTAQHSSVHTSDDPVRATVSRRVHLAESGQNSVPGSTRLAPECVRDPITPLAHAVPAASVSRHSLNANTLASDMKVLETPKRRKLNTPLISTPDSPSVLGISSLPPSSSRCNDATFSSTTSDCHGRGGSGLPDSLPPGRAIPGVVGATSDSRMTDSSPEGEVRCLEDDQMPRTPTELNTTINLDVNDVTSPADIVSTEVQPPSSDPLISKESMARKTVNSDRRSKKSFKSGSSTRQVKDKPKLVTPLEYAQKLQSCLDLQLKTNYLRGKCIFYVGGDMTYASTTTRGRMDYIVKHGGTLVSKYDPAIVTHIVTDAGVRHTLQALSLKSLSDIPDNIPTVTWSWVISGYRRAGKHGPKLLLGKGDKRTGEAGDDRDDENNAFDFEFLHAAFSERMDAGCNWKNMRGGKQSEKAAHDSGDVSHISAFSQEKPAQTEQRYVPLTVLPPAPLDLKRLDGGKTDKLATSKEREKAWEGEDPLAEYYAQARAEREAQWNRDASDSDDGDDDHQYPRGPVPRRGFTCDLKGHKPSVCVNQHIVDKLEELRELHKAKSSEDDRWRAYSYGKCIPALRSYPKPIKSFSEARSIRGVGEKTALKIMEIINTGDLKRIKYENTEDVASTKIFQGIYGVGRHTAFTWFASGLRTLDDVRARKGGLKLSTAQEIGLKFYDDINSRMPREEARKIFEIIKPIALAIDGELFVEIMGSYRRGKADCGDIDILITRPTLDGKTHQGVLRTLLERLHAAGIITEDLAIPDDFSDLELIYRGLCKLPESNAMRRRIDFLCVPWVSRGAALLYYTGDDIFNRAMRLKANRHGYSLNQRGLYAGVVRDPHDRQKKVCGGHIVASETEEEIFKILGVPWQEPHERVRN